MAALTITDADVRFSDVRPPRTQIVQVGEAVTQGEVIRVGYDVGESVDKYYLAKCSDANEANFSYIALCKGDVDDYIVAIPTGVKMYISTGVVVGELYCLGTVDGTIVPIGDLVTGNYLSIVGYGEEANTIITDYNVTGVAVA